MELTSHDRTGRALELLRDGLKPFVEQQLETRYGNQWRTEVKKILSGKTAASRPRPDLEVLNDVANVLLLMDKAWGAVFRPLLGNTERVLVLELAEFRRMWAHQVALSEEDAYRVLDSASRLLSAVKAPQAEEALRLKHELLQSKLRARQAHIDDVSISRVDLGPSATEAVESQDLSATVTDEVQASTQPSTQAARQTHVRKVLGRKTGLVVACALGLCVALAAIWLFRVLPGRPPEDMRRQTVVLLDLVKAQEDSSRETSVLEVLDRLIDSLSYGDGLILIGPPTLPARDPRALKIQVPNAPFDSEMHRDLIEARIQGRLQVRSMVAQLLNTPQPGRDLFSLLRVASEYTQYPLGRESLLVVFSRMIHSWPGLYMGRGEVPSKDWVRTRSQQRLLPDLSGTCVVVIGLRQATLPDAKLKTFWESYFEEAGVAELRFHTAISPQSPLNCR